MRYERAVESQGEFLVNLCKISIIDGKKVIEYASKSENWKYMKADEINLIDGNFMIHMSSFGDIVVLDFDDCNDYVIKNIRDIFKNSVIARTTRGIHVYLRVSDEELRRYIGSKQYHYVILDDYKAKIEIYSNFSNRFIIVPVLQNDRAISYVNGKYHNKKYSFSNFVKHLNNLSDSSEFLRNLFIFDEERVLDGDVNYIREKDYTKKTVKSPTMRINYDQIFGVPFKNLNMKIIYDSLLNAKIGERNTKFFYAYAYYVAMNDVINTFSEDKREYFKDLYLCGITKDDFYKAIDKIYYENEKHDKNVCRYILEKYEFKNKLRYYISSTIADYIASQQGLTASYCYISNGRITYALDARDNYSLYAKKGMAFRVENVSDIKVYKVSPGLNVDLPNYIRIKAYDYESGEHVNDYIVFKTNKRTGFKGYFIDNRSNAIQGQIDYYIPFAFNFEYFYVENGKEQNITGDDLSISALNVLLKLYDLNYIITGEKISYCYEFFNKSFHDVNDNDILNKADMFIDLYEKNKISKFYLEYHVNSLLFIASRKSYDWVVKNIISYCRENDLKISRKLRYLLKEVAYV